MAIEKVEALSSPVIGEDVPILIEATDYRGNRYPLNGTTKIYLTVKSDLSWDDNVAEIQLDSVTDSTRFQLSQANMGIITITIPSTDTATLDPDKVYFLDVKAIWSGDTKYIIRAAEIRFVQRVTKSTS